MACLANETARLLLIRASIKEATTFLHGCLEPTTNHVHPRSLAAETTDTPSHNYYASQIVILHARSRCASRNNAAANSAANLLSHDSRLYFRTRHFLLALRNIEERLMCVPHDENKKQRDTEHIAKRGWLHLVIKFPFICYLLCPYITSLMQFDVICNLFNLFI